MNDMSAKYCNTYLYEIIKANELINLTSVTELKQAKILHLEDSLSILPYINESEPGLYGDLGCGGGFPGVPIFFTTGRNTILIDSRTKKIEAIGEALLSTFDINGVDCVNSHNFDEAFFQFEINNRFGEPAFICGMPQRIEDVGRKMRGDFSVLSARALASLPVLAELASPLLKICGTLIAMKAKLEDEELEQTCALEHKTGLKIAKIDKVKLSDDSLTRNIVVFEKKNEPAIKLPRRNGIAQKRPLKP